MKKQNSKLSEMKRKSKDEFRIEKKMFCRKRYIWPILRDSNYYIITRNFFFISLYNLHNIEKLLSTYHRSGGSINKWKKIESICNIVYDRSNAVHNEIYELLVNYNTYCNTINTNELIQITVSQKLADPGLLGVIWVNCSGSWHFLGNSKALVLNVREGNL